MSNAKLRFNDLAVVLFQNNSGIRTVSQSCTNARVLGLFGAKSTIERIKLFSAYIHGDSLALPLPCGLFSEFRSSSTPLLMTSYELYTIPEKSGNGNQKMDSFCRYRGTDHVQQKQHRQANNCWHHTRACKYNVSVLGTNFECEGVNCTYFNFTQW